MRLSCFVPLLLALHLGCSGDDESSGSSGGAKVFTGPQGAVNMEVYPTEEQTCPPGNLHVDLGTVKTDPPAKVFDGDGSTKVTCSVVAQGGMFAASAAMVSGASDFSFGDVVSDGGSAAGWVRFEDPATGIGYKSSSGKPCVFQFAPESAQGIEAGSVFMQFDCSDLVSEADPAAVCSSRYGYVLVDHCDGGV